jgi:hypothetical protein
MKSRIWIIIFSAVVVICTAVWLLFSYLPFSQNVVGIYQDGKLVKKIDLNTVTNEYEIPISGDAGEDIILVSQGHIKMKSAQCPDKICVKHGELKSASSPIVCLPNKIVIKFEESSQSIDAKTGVE